MAKFVLHGNELFKHLWKSLFYLAVSFSSISGRVYPTWQSAFQVSLEESILPSNQLLKHLEEPILQGNQLLKHLWKSLSCMAVSFSSISRASLAECVLNGSQLFKDLWKSLSCMAVSFSSISGRDFPAWQSAFQASLEESILHGSELLKHL